MQAHEDFCFPPKMRKIMVSNKWLFIILFVFFMKNNVYAQMQTDRPDQTEGVFLIPKNTFQVETGFQINAFPNENTYDLPNTLLKYGISERIEAQSILNFGVAEGNFQLAPITLGLKYLLSKEKKFFPEITLIGRFQIKGLGYKDDISHSIPSLILAMEHTLTDVFSLGYNFGYSRQSSEKQDIYLTLSPYFQVTEKWGLFIDALYGLEDKRTILNTGFLCQIGEKLILDFGIGKHFNDAQKYYITTGISFNIE